MRAKWCYFDSVKCKGGSVMDTASITVIQYMAVGLSLGFTLGYGVCWLQTWWLNGSRDE